MNRRCPHVGKSFDRYYPLDELLDIPRVRILRALTHFDWTSSTDLQIALDIEDSKRAWDAFARNLSNLSNQGVIDRAGRGTTHLYRINDSGRAQLKRLLARGTLADIEAASP